MKGLKTLLAGAVVVTALALPLQSASAWWGGPWGGGPWGGPWAGGPWGGGPWGGPWGGLGPWGGPGGYPLGLAGIPGWTPSEVADKYDFYAPYGPSISDIRRFHRDLAWGRPFDDLYLNPLGPSGTDIRRAERREFYRGMGLPY